MATYRLADPTETRNRMVSAGHRQLAAFERRIAGCPLLADIIRGSMGYSLAKKLAAGNFKVAGERTA